MSGDFIDSNVFVYLVDHDSVRSSKAAEVVRRAILNGNSHVSSQVVQEVLHVITTRITSPVTVGDAKRFLREALVPLWSVNPSPALYDRALDLADRYHYHFYDSLILAAALQAGCDRLLSEDFQDGQVIEGLTVHNPFA